MRNMIQQSMFAFKYFLAIVALHSCSKPINSSDTEEQCPPLIANQGKVSTKVKGSNIKLELPEYANIRRKPQIGCNIARSFSIDFIWHAGQLSSESANRFKFKESDYKPVTVYFNGELIPSEKYPEDTKAWKFESKIKHKLFPLDLLDKYYWDHPLNPSEKSLLRSKSDFMWGIRGTNNSNTNAPFVSQCDIQFDSNDLTSASNGTFSSKGDAKCRGWVELNTPEGNIKLMIDVWSFRGRKSGENTVKEINKIYNTVFNEATKYIKD